MENIQVVTEFLKSTLPGALVAKALGLAPVVVAVIGLLMQYVPWADARRRWLAPLLALGLGLTAGFVTVGMDTTLIPLAIGMGLLIALTAIGAHSGGKNVVQAAKVLYVQQAPDAHTAASVLGNTFTPPVGSPVLYRLKNGELRPAVIVRPWSATCANLVVTLDGSNDTGQIPNGTPAKILQRWRDDKGTPHDCEEMPLQIWATSVVFGDGPGQWTWPATR